MPVTVRLPAVLRPYAGGAATVEVEGTTVGAVLAELERLHPGVGRRVRDEQGQLRRHVHIYVGPDRVRAAGDAVPPSAEVTILPAVSGGCGPPAPAFRRQ